MDKSFLSIRIKEKLSQDWSIWFDGLSITSDENGTTLQGIVPDQSAVRGILGKMWDLNLTVVSFCMKDL